VKYLAFVAVCGSLVSSATAIQNNGRSSELNEILNQMRAHDIWQNRHLVEYQLRRRFYAANPRFKQESMLEVKTLFRQPGTFESQVLRSEGSELIRERVFNKILEAEKDAGTEKGSQESDISPENYDFAFIRKQDCDGRPCYNLRIVPKKKDKYSLDGQIWVDAEEGAIVRMKGSPAKRPSLWTFGTQLERRYERLDGVWLCNAMESTSDIVLAGKSVLRVDYTYLDIQTENATN
jgi:hypothetical protein